MIAQGVTWPPGGQESSVVNRVQVMSSANRSGAFSDSGSVVGPGRGPGQGVASIIVYSARPAPVLVWMGYCLVLTHHIYPIGGIILGLHV